MPTDPLPPSRPVPPLISAPAFVAADLPRRQTILGPILTSKTLALLYGPRGLGKTFVALGIAWAAASGKSFLGWQASRPHRVLYLDGEMAADELQQRLLQFGPPPPTLDLMVSDLHRGDRVDIAYAKGLLDLIRNWGNPELVVIDNLASLAGFTTGDTDRWHELQRGLIVQRRHGRAVLMVHHANKEGLQRGTSRREDVVDLVMAMRRPADYDPGQGARFEIHFEKARRLHGASVEPIEARLGTDEFGRPHWHWQPAIVSDLDRVVALLKDGLTGNEIARELGLTRAKAYRLRAKAMETGLLERFAVQATSASRRLRPPRHQGGGFHHFFVDVRKGRAHLGNHCRRLLAELRGRRGRHGKRALHQRLDVERAPLDDTELFQPAKSRIEQEGLVAHPVSAPASATVGAVLIALADLLPGRPPGIRRQLGRGIMEQGDGAAGVDHAVEPPQRIRAIHPVERAAHDDQVEGAELGSEIVGAAGDEADVRRLCVLGGPRAGLGQHVGRRVHGHHLGRERREGAGERAGTAAKVEQAMPGAQGGGPGDPADQRRRIGHPSLLVVRGGGAETVGLERDRLGIERHELLLARPENELLPISPSKPGPNRGQVGAARSTANERCNRARAARAGWPLHTFSVGIDVDQWGNERRPIRRVHAQSGEK